MIGLVPDSGIPKLVDTNVLLGSEESDSVNNTDGINAMALSSSQCELNPLSSIEDCSARKYSGPDPLDSAPISTPCQSKMHACAPLIERHHALTPLCWTGHCWPFFLIGRFAEDDLDAVTAMLMMVY
ncbi:hypothetical protein Nepgr_031770 [Nepenthes gracilis]|uniref:Uncharacterized protein n=1 Tax=Nepenthes gracilis TaxID=150966 RepID=A0AAD3TJF9_NEPGR|nr:hypothetical protein Nepgr_031770 [Nepenthes gracilis]